MSTGPSRRWVVAGALAVGGAAAVGPWFRRLVLAGNAPRPHAAPTPGPLVHLRPHEAVLVESVADWLIPRTETPGARDAGAVAFVDAVLAEEETEDQRVFRDRATALEASTRDRLGGPFSGLPLKQREDELSRLDGLLTAASQGVDLWPQLDREFAITPAFDPQRVDAADRGSVELLFALKGLVVSAYYASPQGREELGQPHHPFHGAYAGCTHPEHGGGSGGE